MSNAKEHKKFEFGSKASILIDQATGIIMAAINFTQTLHDSKTLPEVLEQYQRLNGKQVKEVFVDRGYKDVIKQLNWINIDNAICASAFANFLTGHVNSKRYEPEHLEIAFPLSEKEELYLYPIACN